MTGLVWSVEPAQTLIIAALITCRNQYSRVGSGATGPTAGSGYFQIIHYG